MINQLINLNKLGNKVDFSWLANLEKIIKKRFKLTKQVSIALVDKKFIRNLNKVYRGKDKVTDVLSFIMDDKYILGEIIICLDQARRQAKEKNTSYKGELQLLTVHGILHLLGYDHEISDSERIKQEKEESLILGELNK